MGIRSMVLEDGNIVKTPFLNIDYSAEDVDAIWPKNPESTGQSLGQWPPEGYEFIIEE